MQWPYKTTVRFQGVEGNESRLDYWVSATNSSEAERALKERLLSNEVFGYRVAAVRPATRDEAEWVNLPPNCVMLLA
jgi:hypothetical protein